MLLFYIFKINIIGNVFILFLFNMKKFLWILLIIFLFVVAWILLRVLWVLSLYDMVGSSMNPALEENDVMIASNITNLQRGDIISFIPVGKETSLIKRIVWLPWETVKIKEDSVFICKTLTEDCYKLDEAYLPESLKTTTRCGITEFELKEWYFVMWDNRWFSTDSLCCFSLGCSDESNYEVPLQNIKWKIFLKLSPTVRFY